MTTIKEYTDAIEVVEEEIEKEVLFKPESIFFLGANRAIHSQN
ncbi:MAG: hypothetical protein ACUZ8E_06970 [Candidatus Anammoxibacter sp.]